LTLRLPGDYSDAKQVSYNLGGLYMLMAIIIGTWGLFSNSFGALPPLNNLSQQLGLLHKAIVRESYKIATSRINELRISLNTINERFKDLSHKSASLKSERKEILEELLKLKKEVVSPQHSHESKGKISIDPISKESHQGLK
jgi:hypothetical protein